jgi:hypothetical protein
VHLAAYLLQMLLAILGNHGLAAEALDPWRAWVIFKQYARVVDESPDPGVSVQLSRNHRDHTVSLLFVRQAVEIQEDWLDPTGGAVIEFTFEDSGRPEPHVELWSFDYGSFERFVDVVEQTPAIADRLLQAPLRSSVYWQPAS